MELVGYSSDVGDRMLRGSGMVVGGGVSRIRWKLPI